MTQEETNRKILSKKICDCMCRVCYYFDMEVTKKYGFMPCSLLPIIFKLKHNRLPTYINKLSKIKSLSPTQKDIHEYILKTEKIKKMKEILS